MSPALFACSTGMAVPLDGQYGGQTLLLSRASRDQGFTPCGCEKNLSLARGCAARPARFSSCNGSALVMKWCTSRVEPRGMPRGGGILRGVAAQAWPTGEHPRIGESP